MKCNYILTIGLFVFSQGVMADNNAEATATVSGEVITSLSIGNINDAGLVMPTLVLPDSSEETSVELTCPSNAVTYDSNGGNPFAHGVKSSDKPSSNSENLSVGNAIGTCAELGVRGELGYHYSVSPLPTSITLADGVTLTSISCASQNNFTIVGNFFGNSDLISCGGKVTVDDTASAATYGGSFDVQVVYD
ncbi:MAG: DUF4402 domain-containing protein [Methylococcales bacterium]|nr:DUF4402 domain-containing protein [Methylococcales bacterium]